MCTDTLANALNWFHMFMFIFMVYVFVFDSGHILSCGHSVKLCIISLSDAHSLGAFTWSIVIGLKSNPNENAPYKHLNRNKNAQTEWNCNRIERGGINLSTEQN